MSGETQITVVGNVVNDPELRFTPSGAAVANFRIASTPRRFNKQTNQWDDGEALFLTVNAWQKQAENVAESLAKGMRVVVQGNLEQRSYENREGEKRTVYELAAQEVAPSLKYATAKVARNPREGGGFGGQQPQQAAQQDAWGTPANSQQEGGGFGGNLDSEIPF